MNTDRDRRLKENEERIRSIKAELVQHHQALLRCENELNALAIERTNLEDAPDEEQIEIPPELQAIIPTNPMPQPRRIWPKVTLGGLALVAVLLGLSALGMFNNDGSTSVARRADATHAPVTAPSIGKGNEAPAISSSTIPRSSNAILIPNKINNVPNEVPMNILPGITYTSEISYSMKSSNVTLVEVQDTPQITLHLNHAPQSFFIPLRTSFRIDNDRMDTVSTLMVFTDSKKSDLEIRFESPRLPLERKILGVSSSQ